MKHGALTAIAHNIADSMGSGLGFMIGVWHMAIYTEAAKSPDKHITVDLLTGAITGGPASDNLYKAITEYCDVFPKFCAQHGAASSDFSKCELRFSKDHMGRHLQITVRDLRGKESVTEFRGDPPKRIPKR